METVLHKAATRGHADHGWLNSHHTFSFANYYEPGRMHFGALRVLNDDVVAGGKGFSAHPHDNMEIVSIPLEGTLKHEDSMGNKTLIREGEVQVMSAGTGVTHSEFNGDPANPVKFLQIWIFPEKRNIAPRYGQIKYTDAELSNTFRLVVSPDGKNDSTIIRQRAWFSLSAPEKDKVQVYKLNDPRNLVYIFLLDGALDIGGIQLSKRDGLGIKAVSEVQINASEASRFLIMEVPDLNS